MGRGGASADTPGERQRRRPAPTVLPGRLPASRGVWLALATAFLTVATVLSVTLGGSGAQGSFSAISNVWGGAESALASAWAGGGNDNRTGNAKWRDTLTAGFSQWHGTRKSAAALLPNGTMAGNATDVTAGVVDEIPVDEEKERMVHKNPKDTSWQQFTVVQPSGRARHHPWAGTLHKAQLTPGEGADKSRSLTDQVFDDLNPWRGDVDGITREAIEQLYCSLGDTSLRIQVVRGKGYVVGEAASRQQARHHRIKLQIQEVLEKWKPEAGQEIGEIPNSDVIMWTGNSYPPDAPNNGGKAACGAAWGPLLTPGRRLTGQAGFTLLVPDETFAGMPEAGIWPWRDEQPEIRREADAHPWDDRRRVLLFRGARSTPSRLALFESDALAESNLTDFLYTDVDEARDTDVDTKFAGDSEGFLKPPQQCDTRYILHMQGSAHSGRLKYAMACNSVVIWPRHELKGREEFFHHLLMDGVNVVMTEPVTAANGGEHILKVLQKLEADPKATKRIGRRAGGLIQYHLRQDDVLEHWHQVFRQHAELQKFTLEEPHQDAVPLDDSIARGDGFGDLPATVTAARNCSVCEAFGLGVPEPPAQRKKAAQSERVKAAKARARSAAKVQAGAEKRRQAAAAEEEAARKQEEKEADDRQKRENEKKDQDQDGEAAPAKEQDEKKEGEEAKDDVARRRLRWQKRLRRLMLQTTV